MGVPNPQLPDDVTQESAVAQAPTLDDVYSPRLRPGDYELTRPIAEQDPMCPNCGHPFDSDEWEVRHLHGGASAGENWLYTCPKCNNETLECGT